MARQHTPVYQPPRLRDDGPMYARRAHEIFRLEHDELLYRMYLYPEGEVIFSVTGDNIRLGLLTQEDLHWDHSFDLPRFEETTQLIHLHAQPLRTLRALVRHLSAYLDKHQTPFFFYKVLDDPRRHQLYQRLLQRHAPLVQAYQAQRSPDGAYMLYTRR